MYKIFLMKTTEIFESAKIWHSQYLKYCKDEEFPDFWNGGEKEIEKYLEIQIENSAAIVAKKNEVIVGFLTWMYFDFHSERTAFCPIIGHAAIEEDSSIIYETLYNYASKKWVDDDRFNHLWMIFHDNYVIKDMLYDIGFGSYVIDACTKVEKPTYKSDCGYKISKAEECDTKVLINLVEQSIRYYLAPPIFLKREPYTEENLIDIIKNSTLFIAWDNDEPIGFINLSVQKGYDTENLASINSGLLDEVGAYIKPTYRGVGIGKCLLNEAMIHCVMEGITYLHVCFETANPYANKFWRKYFKPKILSIRRTVNKDSNTVG